jgi:hypothetical protein
VTFSRRSAGAECCGSSSERALALGLVSAEDFDRFVRPSDMIGPKAK